MRTRNGLRLASVVTIVGAIAVYGCGSTPPATVGDESGAATTIAETRPQPAEPEAPVTLPAPEKSPAPAPAVADAAPTPTPVPVPVAPVPADYLPIVPDAAGFGMDTVAGSGRHLDRPATKIIKVTNLNTEGPGSLREAFETEGPRTIVFEVSGNIDFTPYGGLSIPHPYCTVAGQTAPAPGITLKGCELRVDASDVLLQHIRVRVGDHRDPNKPLKNKAGWSQWSERDCMKLGHARDADGTRRPAKRIVVDHCSFSWATDENVQTRSRDFTFRHCIFSECLNSPKHHKGGHSKALLILDQGRDEGKSVALVGNLFAYNGDRTPQVAGGCTAAIVNNFIYGAYARPYVGMTFHHRPYKNEHHGGGVWASAIGNHFDNVPGPYRLGPSAAGIFGKVFIDDTLVTYTPAERKRHEAFIKTTLDDLQFADYVAGANGMHARPHEVVDERIRDVWHASHMLVFRKWMGEDCPADRMPDNSRVDEPPVVVPGLKIKPVAEVREWVLANAGARPADRDPVDARVVRQVRARTGDIPKSQEDVGGWPALAENRIRLTPPENPCGDDDADGYTNLEEWLHGFAARVEGRWTTHAATVIHSTDLGWKAGQDVTSQFAELLARGRLKPGTELALDHTHKLSGSHAVPDGVTISAVKGAGFDVTDAVDFKGSKPLLDLGNETTLRNLTIRYLNTPPLGPTGEKRGVTFTGRIGVQASGKRDVTLENCHLTGSIGHNLKLTDCLRPKVIGCHIEGGHWSVFLCGVSNGVFRRCVIEKCQGDGIKTGGGRSGAVRNMLIDECVFQDNLRDGIDCTGGFNESVVRNCIFRRLGVSAMDIKGHYETKTGRIEDLPPENVGILVEKCLMHDMPNAFVFTTLDCGQRKGQGKPLLNASNMKKYAPHDIDINECVFGHVEKPLRSKKEGGYGVNYPSEQGEHTRFIHLKDAYGIRYRNIRFFGERIMPVLKQSIGGSRHLTKDAAEAIDHSVTGNVLDEPAPVPMPGVTAAPFARGPQ